MLPVPTIPILRDDVVNHSFGFQIARVILDLYRLPSFTSCPRSAMDIHFVTDKTALIVITVLY
jgi:hypothetical protein